MKTTIEQDRDTNDNTLSTAAIRLDQWMQTAAIKRAPNSQRHYDQLFQYLKNAGVMKDDEKKWLPAIGAIMDQITPRQSNSNKATLHPAIKLIASIMLMSTPKLPNEILEAIHNENTIWSERIQAWPDFDIVTFITSRTGIRPKTPTGMYEGGTTWAEYTTPNRAVARKMIYDILNRNGTPMTGYEITEEMRNMANRQKITGTEFSENNIMTMMQRRPEFQWAGVGAYGLKAWDIGYSEDTQHSGKRPTILDEIIQFIDTKENPIEYDDIERHILKRFRVTPIAIRSAFSRNKQHFVTKGNKITLSDNAFKIQVA